MEKADDEEHGAKWRRSISSCQKTMAENDDYAMAENDDYVMAENDDYVMLLCLKSKQFIP